MKRKNLRQELRALSQQSKYDRVIERVFQSRYEKGALRIMFTRDDLLDAANQEEVHIRNIGDLVYTYRFRRELPESIRKTSFHGRSWSIRLAGNGIYEFVQRKTRLIKPDPNLEVIDIPDATPDIVERYSFNDEQALLAKIRYNRLLDVFLGICCYSLQNHLRTNIEEYGQIEIDELYVGVDKDGRRYAIPVQVKRGGDALSIEQTIQDYEFCKRKLSTLQPMLVSAQFLDHEEIAIFRVKVTSDEHGIEDLRKVAERHFRLVRDEESQKSGESQ